MKPVEEFIYRMKFNSKTMTVDVEQVGELIRCKECKYYQEIGESGYCAHRRGLNGKPCADDYCSRAEKEEE